MEIAVDGNEGVGGVSLLTGNESTFSRALVQNAGGAFRLTAELMKKEFHQAGPVLHLLLRYTQALITKWCRQRTAIGTTLSISSFLAGCCSAWIVYRVRKW
jgi:hypothetical protein